MDVVLAANRNYRRQVEKHVKRMREQFPDLTFADLKERLDQKDYESFKEIWGHTDKKKFFILKSIVEQIFRLGNPVTKENDYDLMKSWATRVTLQSKATDLIGSLGFIGIATFQHLRITFGIDTVKPDQRVMEVLEREFNLKLSQFKSILAVEQIAEISEHRVLEIDQIFVKYGSGYCPSGELQVKEEVENIIRILLKENVPKHIISKATRWSTERIDALI